MVDSKLVNKAYRAAEPFTKPKVTYDHAPIMTKEDRFMNDEEWRYITDRWKKYGFIYTLEVSFQRRVKRGL